MSRAGTSWRTIALWRYAEGLLIGVDRLERLTEMHRWRAGRPSPECQWFVDARRSVLVSDPHAVDWGGFPTESALAAMKQGSVGGRFGARDDDVASGMLGIWEGIKERV